MSPFMTSQLTGSAVNTYFHVTTRKDDTTSTRRNRRPSPKPQVQILGRTKPTTDVECSPSPSSPPDSCPRRVSARVNSTPLAQKRALPLRRPTQCRSEQGDIEEIMCFLNQVLRCVMCVYQAMSSTVKWLAVVAFVIEAMMMSLGFSSARGGLGGGFIGPIVVQLTSTAMATGHAKIYPSPHPRTSEAAVLNFLADQIDHAHDLLTVVGGLGDEAFFGYHQANVRRFLSRARNDSLSGGSKTEVNLTVDFRGLGSTLIQSLSPHGFFGRTISHALDEVTYHSKRGQMAFLVRRGAMRESRLDSVFLLTTSNLLLEVSSILSQTESIIPDVEAIHRQLSRNLLEVSASLQSRKATASRRSIWTVFVGQRVDARVVENESVQAFMAGLETSIANLRQLKAYLEWITNRLSRQSFIPSGSIASSHTDQSCSSALRVLFDRASRASKKLSSCCRCPDPKDPPMAPIRVEFNIPSSRTLRTLI